MLDQYLANPLALGAVHAATALALIAAALVISSVVRMNKGAKANSAFVVISAGIIVAALVPANLALADFGFANFSKWNELITLFGSALVFFGVLAWRRIVRRMVS